MSRTTDHTRKARADRLRDAVRALVDQSSLRQAASITGVPIGALRSLLDGRTPQEANLATLEAWAKLRDAAAQESRSDRAPPSTELQLKGAKEIGEIIRSIRSALGLSQQQLGELLGMSNGQAEVSRWERGVKAPDYEKLERIARLAGQRADLFHAGESSPSGPPVPNAEALRAIRNYLTHIVSETADALLLLKDTPPASLPFPEQFDFVVPDLLARRLIAAEVKSGSSEAAYSVQRLQHRPDRGEVRERQRAEPSPAPLTWADLIESAPSTPIARELVATAYGAGHDPNAFAEAVGDLADAIYRFRSAKPTPAGEAPTESPPHPADPATSPDATTEPPQPAEAPAPLDPAVIDEVVDAAEATGQVREQAVPAYRSQSSGSRISRK